MQKLFFRRTLIISILIGTFFLLAELSLRFVLHGKIKTFSETAKKSPFVINGRETLFSDRYIEDAVFAFKLKPNYSETDIDRGYNLEFSFRTNSEGFRQTYELEGLRETHKHTIMVIGDSATFGWGVNQEYSYPEVLNSLYADSARVLNFGVGGWSFAEYYLTFKQYAKKVNPDLVIIGVIPANDFRELNNTSWEGKERFMLPEKIERKDYYIDKEGHFRTTYTIYRFPILRESYLCIYLSSKLSIVGDKIKQLFFKNDPEALAASLMNGVIKESQSPIVILFLPVKYDLGNERRKKEIDKFIGRLQPDSKIKLLDFYALLENRPNIGSFYVDGSHFSEEGNRFVAETLFKFIKENNLLKDKK